jgi:hypothetical protein
MQTRIVLTTGKEFVTDADADAVMTQMLAAESYAKVRVPGGYLEYSSTMSCSWTGASTSCRSGARSTRP